MFTLAGVAPSEVVDKILVIVNDEIITRGDVDRILLPIYQQYKDLYSGSVLQDKIGEARRNVLESLIGNKLLLTEAKRNGVEVHEAQVQARIDEVRSQFETEEEFREALAQEMMVLSDLRKKFMEKIQIEQLIDMRVRKGGSVSPNEILNFYEERNSFRLMANLELHKP